MPEQINADYFKGFNEGYILAEYANEVATKIAKIESALPRLEGFKDGYRQLTLDKIRDHAPEWMRPPSVTPKTPDQGRDKTPEINI